MNKISAILSVILISLIFTACGSTETSKEENKVQTPDVSLTVEPTQEPEISSEPESPGESKNGSASEIAEDGSMYADLSNGMPSVFEASDGWTNGSMFNVFWRAGNVTFEDSKMQLIIDNDSNPQQGIPYSGGEFRSKDFYGYGRYEVSMRAIKNDGVVSSFFTYTGPSDDNPWDEIDVEILGKDTTKVQFNYFTDGVGEHEYLYDLGFDASEDFHTFAFEWHKDKIVWFVDDVEVHSVTDNIPMTEGKIMMNAWCGIGVDEWLNAFDDENVPLTAEYEWVRFTPFDE